MITRDECRKKLEEIQRYYYPIEREITKLINMDPLVLNDGNELFDIMGIQDMLKIIKLNPREFKKI